LIVDIKQTKFVIKFRFTVFIEFILLNPIHYENTYYVIVHSSDPRCKLDGVNTHVEDRKDRMQNWELLMKNINSFYQVRCPTC